MDYAALKLTHVCCVSISYLMFVGRGILMLRASPLLQRAWLRLAPHVVDTLLLVSAIALAIMSRQYPLAQGWLTAKVAGLVVYIGLGTIALKRGKTRGTRVAAWFAAQAVFLYIVAVALTHRPLPW